MNLKTILISFLLIVFTFSVNAQLVKFNPLLSQGYLVLNQQTTDGKDIASYQVTIYERVFVDSANHYDKIVDMYLLQNPNNTLGTFTSSFNIGTTQQKVINTNYMKLKKDYYVPNGENYYGIGIKAFDKYGRLIETVDPELPPICQGCGDYETVHKYLCNGPTYAYKIDVIKRKSNDWGYLSTSSTARYYEEGADWAIPYYQYMDQAEFDILTDNPAQFLSDHYGLNYRDISDENINHRILHNVESNQGLKNKDGEILTGTVHAIAKAAGYWRISPPQSKADIDLSNYNAGLDWAINTINDYPSDVVAKPDEQPDLYCSALGGGYEPNFEETDAGYWVIHCLNKTKKIEQGAQLDEVLDFILGYCYSFSKDDHVKEVISALSDLNIASIEINPVNDENGTKINLEIEDFYNDNGELETTDIPLKEGLYEINYVFNDNSFIPKFVDVNDNLINSNLLSKSLEVSIFSNPIGRDKNNFTLHLKSDKTSIIDYTLWDTQGNKLYQKKIFISKGETKDIDIFVNRLPSGALINKFTFTDGSVLSVGSIKE